MYNLECSTHIFSIYQCETITTICKVYACCQFYMNNKVLVALTGTLDREYNVAMVEQIIRT